MCLKCNGWSDQEIHDWYLRTIRDNGWVVIFVEASGKDAAFAYTIGLTRFHGHPELLVSGMEQAASGSILNEFGAQVGSGAWFHPGQLLRQGGRRLQFVPVDDPTQLVEAQAMYASEAGLVPALQVAYTDDRGHWPWHRGWRGGRRGQPMFGTPAHR